MGFDSDFDSKRLTMLAQQHFSTRPVHGIMIFSASEDHLIDWMRWKFSDVDYKFIKECGFRNLLLMLLDTLIEYRNIHNQPNASHGVVNISGQSADITWISSDDFERMCKE